MERRLDSRSKRPGNAHYCVELQSLGYSEGHMTPEQFDGKREDYDLEVTNPLSPQVVLTFGLQLKKYDLQHTPVIEVDGVELDYTPLTIISKVIKLNEDPGPFDRVVHVSIQDPDRGTFWHRTNRKEYRIHIRQPPEYSKLVIAEELVVTGNSGEEIVAKPPFNRNASTIDYIYNVSEEVTSVKIEFACPKYTSAIDFNQQPVSMYSPREGWSPSGTVQTVDMKMLTRKRVTLTCKYSGSVKRAQREYLLTLTRDVGLGVQAIEPKLLPDLGYCLSKMDYMARLQSSFAVDAPVAQNDEAGYFCLTDCMEPKLMVQANDPMASQAEVILKDRDTPYQMLLQPFLPVTIPHARTRHQLVLEVQLGSTKRNIPLSFMYPAPCSSMDCPKHYRLRGDLATQARAEWRLCMADECRVDQDRDTCCEQVASCKSVTCPEGKTPSSSMDCLGKTCTKVDELRCCNHHEYCVDTFCPLGYTMRIDAATTPCTSRVCKPSDHSICCEKQASCKAFQDNFGCPDGHTPPKIDSRHCLLKECTKQDEVHCCFDLVSCESYACPAGLTLRKEAAKLTCIEQTCGPHDAPRCCKPIVKHRAGNLPVTMEEGVVTKINDDGTYGVKFKDGREDREVPEWALKAADSNGGLNLRVGQKVLGATTPEGYHPFQFNAGMVKNANSDGTYAVKYDNGDWDGAVPAWAVRAVDSEGNRFVHTGMLAPGQSIITSRQASGGYMRTEFAVGTVLEKLEDDTFVVQYASGSTDEHVPVWDLRIILPTGRSAVQPDYQVGDYVEVSNTDKAREERFQPRLRNQMRTKYIFGWVRQVNPGNTYGVKYDCGGWEADVPDWAIRKVEKGESQKQMKYEMNDRVEARASSKATFVQQLELDKIYGIAVRERLNWYRELACWPAAQECLPKPDWADGGPPEIGLDLPIMNDYDIVRNPWNRTLCSYDTLCEDAPETPGCNVNNRPGCRYCGFGAYSPCQKAWNCTSSGNETEEEWEQPRKDFCCKYFNTGCPYVCRWGKYWPDEAKAWGPWWSPEKRTWCCEHKKLGCPRLDDSFDIIVTTTKPQPTTTMTAVCDDGFHLSVVEPGECPSNLDDLEPCERAGSGMFCTGSGHCSTDTELNNCGEDQDVYLKQAIKCPNSEGVRGYRFAHNGYWLGGIYTGKCQTTAECAVKCDLSADCKAFSWKEADHACFVHEELGNRVLGSPSMAFMRCEEAEMLDLQVKFSSETRRKSEHISTIFPGNGPMRSWVGHTSFLVPLMLVGLTAMALLAWSRRMARTRRRDDSSQDLTVRAVGLPKSRPAPPDHEDVSPLLEAPSKEVQM